MWQPDGRKLRTRNRQNCSYFLLRIYLEQWSFSTLIPFYFKFQTSRSFANVLELPSG